MAKDGQFFFFFFAYHFVFVATDTLCLSLSIVNQRPAALTAIFST